jgi:hypothetical protein
MVAMTASKMPEIGIVTLFRPMLLNSALWMSIVLLRSLTDSLPMKHEHPSRGMTLAKRLSTRTSRWKFSLMLSREIIAF